MNAIVIILLFSNVQEISVMNRTMDFIDAVRKKGDAAVSSGVNPILSV